nr:MAG TPA: Protein of unknown function (DUF2591) [Caudoviricetes sp.]
MKNYEEMSDLEIAQKVFFFVSGNLCPNGGLAHICSDGFFFFDNKNIKRKFDPCNNPADAWPIISDNRISLMYDQSTEKGNEAQWCLASSPCDQHVVDHMSSSKLLRAAMIVFLKMNDGEL